MVTENSRVATVTKTEVCATTADSGTLPIVHSIAWSLV